LLQSILDMDQCMNNEQFQLINIKEW